MRRDRVVIIVSKHILLTLQQANKSKKGIGREGNSNFIQKAGRPRIWWTHVQACFILNEERVKSNISWLQSASERDVFFSFLQSFKSGPGKAVSCELSKVILA